MKIPAELSRRSRPARGRFSRSALSSCAVICIAWVAGAQPAALPSVDTWQGRWTPYRLVDDQALARRLIKATIDLPESTPNLRLVLIEDSGRELETLAVPSQQPGKWAHGFWAPEAAKGLAIELRRADGTLAKRAVSVPESASPLALPLRIDRLNRGLLDRLKQREAETGSNDRADVASYLTQHDVVYRSPAPSWVEGLPLGNGDVGALISGRSGAEQVIHLDKTDIWYTAPDGTALGRSYVGTVRIRYQSAGDFEQRLSLGRAEVTTNDGTYHSTAFVDANRNRFEMEIRSGEFEVVLERKPVTLHVNRRGGYLNAARLFGSWARYATPQQLELVRRDAAQAPTTRVTWGSNGNSCWFTNTAPNMSYAVAVEIDGASVEWRETAEGMVGQVKARGPVRLHAGVATSREAARPLELARRQLGSSQRAAHQQWWRAFWQRSWIELPDKLEENLWYLGVYQQAACSRSDQAISFFGLWHPLDHRTWYDAYVTDAQVPMIWWLTFGTNHLELLYPSHRTFGRLVPEFA